MIIFKNKNAFGGRAGFYTAFVLLLIAGVCCSLVYTTNAWTLPAVKQHIVAGGDYNYPPYEWIDETGQPAGFNVDLIRAIAEVMGWKVTFSLGPWDQVRKDLAAGRIDVLPMYRSEERFEVVDFTSPFEMIYYEIFIRRDSQPVASLDKIKGLEVIVQRDALMHDHLKQNSRGASLVLVESEPEAVRLLASGKHDCAIVSRIGGLYGIARLKLTNLATSGKPLLPREYALAVRKGNIQLRDQLNQGLAIIKNTGQHEKISRKWFGEIEPPQITLWSVLRYAAWIIAPLIFLASAAFAWAKILGKKVAQKTLKLNIELEERRKAEDELEKHRKNLEGLVRERTSNLEEKTCELERSQTALQYLLEDVNEAKRELEQANEKLKELDRLKSMFIASMSHELRTPLNSIIGFTGIILQGMINAEQRDQLEHVLRAGRHLLALITDVIDIAKIESGNVQRQTEEFMLEDVIDEACESMQVQIKEKGLDLQKFVPDVKVRMQTDRRRLLQCVLNLLSNAVKFTEKGFVRINAQKIQGSRTQSSGEDSQIDSVEISVTDTGIGINPEDMHLLFKSFIRLESRLNTTTPGTGLGLYLTKKLAVEVLRGDVFAESIEGKGSAFTIRIPVKI